MNLTKEEIKEICRLRWNMIKNNQFFLRNEQIYLEKVENLKAKAESRKNVVFGENVSQRKFFGIEISKTKKKIKFLKKREESLFYSYSLAMTAAGITDIKSLGDLSVKILKINMKNYEQLFKNKSPLSIDGPAENCCELIISDNDGPEGMFFRLRAARSSDLMKILFETLEVEDLEGFNFSIINHWKQK